MKSVRFFINGITFRICFTTGSSPNPFHTPTSSTATPTPKYSYLPNQADLKETETNLQIIYLPLLPSSRSLICQGALPSLSSLQFLCSINAPFPCSVCLATLFRKSIP